MHHSGGGCWSWRLWVHGVQRNSLYFPFNFAVNLKCSKNKIYSKKEYKKQRKKKRESSVQEKVLVRREIGTREECDPYLRHKGLVQLQRAQSPATEWPVWQCWRRTAQQLDLWGKSMLRVFKKQSVRLVFCTIKASIVWPKTDSGVPCQLVDAFPVI